MSDDPTAIARLATIVRKVAACPECHGVRTVSTKFGRNECSTCGGVGSTVLTIRDMDLLTRLT